VALPLTRINLAGANQPLSQSKLDLCQDVPCDLVRLEHEQPYQAIIDAAEARGCDVIVMASHGRKGMSAVVLGSETVKVLTHSPIPVVVIRGQKGTHYFVAS
jgi:nucleotide-binding universal stress UspA family protein